MKRIKFCMTCKIAQTDHPSCICQECRDKKCTNCGRISVSNTQYDDNGKPFCPKCFRTVMQMAVQAGKTNQFTIHQRLDAIESELTIMKRIISGAGFQKFISGPSAARQTSGPEINIESRIDNLIDTMEIPDAPSPSVNDIKNRALEIMLESDKFTENDKD